MQTQHGDLLAETPQRLPVLLSAFAAGILLAISLDLDQQGLASTLSRASGALAAVYLAVILLSLLSRSISNRLTGVLHRLSSWLGISLTGTWVLFSGIGCTATGSLAAGGGPRVLNQLSLPLWILGVVLVVLGLRSIEPTSRETSASSTQILALILIISLGWYLRTVDLETMPYVLSGDEGSAGLVGWEFVEGTRDNLLGLGWFSFPALYFWLLSLGQSIFGRSVYAIRLFSAIAGTLTIAATYWGGKLLFNRNVGLMAGAWLATLHMHVFFSRVAYNNVFDGFFLILAIALLYRG
ncbi:MAG: phospholipid carrier-dependent glycosyltransferase, partial [Anaerolineales bacterium]